MNRYDALEFEWLKWRKSKRNYWLRWGLSIAVGMSGIIFLVSSIVFSPSSQPHASLREKNASISSSVFSLQPHFEVAQASKEGYDIPPLSVHKDKILSSEKNQTFHSSSSRIHVSLDSANVLDLEERFSKSPSWGVALSIATLYYDKSEYKKSVEWAIKTSELNSNSEDAWLIFAKAKYKLGDKASGQRALQTWLKTHESIHANTLLEKITKGTL